MLPTNPSIGSSWPRTLSIARSGSSLKSGVGRRPHLRLTYLAVVLDLYSRRVIGWAMRHHLTVDLAERALTLALSHRPPPRTGSCTTRIAAVSIPPELPASAQCARHHCEHEPTGNCWAMPAWRASSSHSSVDSSIIANTAHGTRRDRTSLSTSKRSLIGYVGTPHSATTPRPSSKRDRL